MALFYADSSVLVKRHATEVGSAWVVDLFDSARGHEVITSHVSMVEVISAFNRRVREGSITAADYPQLRDDFLALCRHSYQLVPVINAVITRARLLLEPHPLRAYDALHLASAVLLNDRLLASNAPALTFLAADDRLLAAAAAEGLPIDNPNHHP